VLNLPAQCIVRLSDILPAGLGKTPLVRGLARVQADMVVLLDLDLLFSISQMSLVAAATCEEPVEPAVPEHEGAQEASAVELTPEIEA